MMVELARANSGEQLTHLGKIARITALSENYLAQLAMSLKGAGLLIGVSGKNGGYRLAQAADQIKVADVVTALIGPIGLTECVAHPDICLASCFCETRLVWALVNHRVMQTLEEFTLADLIDKNWADRIRAEYRTVPYMNPDAIMRDSDDMAAQGCP
jgi:Rrf2 family protein